MEQPEVYNTEEDLIKWLEKDLEKQRINYFSDTKNPVDEMELEDFLFLNIGNIDTNCGKFIIGNINDNCEKNINVNFELNISRIIMDLTTRYKNTLDKSLIDLDKKKINYKINCKGVIFNAHANFSYADIREADFSYVIFNKKVDFIKSKFYGECKFTNTIFKESANFSDAQFYYKNEHDKKFIHNSISFYNNEFYKSLKFENSIFDLNIIIENSTFKSIVYFNNCIFNERFNIYDSDFKDYANFRNLIFNNVVDIKHVKFYGDVDFDFSNFKKNADINNVGFNKSANFINCIFENACISYILNIGNDTICNFTNSTVNKILSINTKKENISIYLDNIKFKNEYSIISIRDIENPIKYLSFKDVIIRGIIEIQNVKASEVNFIGSITNGGLVNPVNFKIDNFSNRESALFLKNEAYARRNVIDALEYKAKEIELHKKELLKNKKDYKKWGDIFSIFLSSFYSNNGLNWVKSLRRTILITIIFFSIFYIPNIFSLNYIFNKDYIYKLVEYFIPTEYDSLMEYVKNANVYTLKKICGIIVYFTGKIMFWYGSVQTVQAFRKFSKGA